MTDRELEQQLRAWYRGRVDAAGAAPMELYASVSAIPDEMPEGAGAGGSRRMLLLLAAAMLVALVVGSAIAIGAGLIPWLNEEPITRLSHPISWEEQAQSDVEAGTYFVDVPSAGGLPPSATVRVTFTLPAGWERVPVKTFLWGQTMWVGFGVVEGVYADPCRPNLGLRKLPDANAVDGIAAALATVPGYELTSIRAATVDGYRGVRVELKAPADSSECVSSESRLLRIHGLYNYIPAIRDNEPMQLWILDVEGMSFVIRAGNEPWATDASRAELTSVIDSIRIDP
jgi:hypothetical protein